MSATYPPFQPIKPPNRLDLAHAVESYRRFGEASARRRAKSQTQAHAEANASAARASEDMSADMSAADWMAQGLNAAAFFDAPQPPALKINLQQAGIAIAFILGILVKFAIG